MSVSLDRRRFLALASAATVTAAGAAAASPWRRRRALIRLGLTSAPANRLRNAGFLQCTIPGLPDYWGTSAPADIADARRVITVTDAGTVPGVRALRLTNPAAGYKLSLVSMKTFVPAPRPYTFSVNLRRASSASVDVALSMGWNQPTAIQVGSEWERHVITYEPRRESDSDHGLGVGIWLSGEGAIDIATPQLEEGDRATPFDLALMDDRPLPVAQWPRADTDVVAGRTPVIAVGRPLVPDGPPLTFGIAVVDPGRRQLDDVAECGFNTVVLFVPLDGGAGGLDGEEGHLAQMRGACDVARARGLRVIAGMAGHGPLDEFRRAAVHAVDRLKDHPAIGAWMIFDEPSRWWAEPPWPAFEALYREIKAADPGRAAFINDISWSRTSAAVRWRSTDLAAVDVYPVGSMENPLAVVAAMAQTINTETAGETRPSAMWLQLYGWDDAPREPTTAEVRAMSYLAFIWGTRTLLFWQYKPMQRELWNAIRPIHDELAQVERTLASPACRWTRTGTAGRRVHYSIWRNANRAYVVACNASPEPRSVSFDIAAPIGAVRRWHDTAKFASADARLNAWFPPYAREVFEVDIRS